MLPRPLDEQIKMKKYQRKVARCLQIFNKDFPGLSGLDDAFQDATVLLLGNAGHTTGYDETSLLTLLQSCGTADGVTRLTLLPGKQYSLVTYATAAQARAACDGLRLKTTTLLVEGKTQGQNKACDGGDTLIYVTLVIGVPECPEDVQYRSPPGLSVLPNFISSEEEKTLLSLVVWDQQSGDDQRGATLKNRQVRHFGYQFQYGSNSIDPQQPLQDAPIPAEVRPIIERMLEAAVVPLQPNQLTVNRYLPGQGIPPHTDSHDACTAELVSLSVGSAVVMDFLLAGAQSLHNSNHKVTCGESSQEGAAGGNTWGDKAEEDGIARHDFESNQATPVVASKETSVEANLVATSNTSFSEAGDMSGQSNDCLSGTSLPNQCTSNSDDRLPSAGSSSLHYAVLLPPRSLCVMSGEARYCWRHGIKSRHTDVYRDTLGRLVLLQRGERISFTFRKTRNTPCNCSYPRYCPSAQGGKCGTTSKGAPQQVLEMCNNDAASIEAQHVQAVYDNIATHFSDTRHKPWPNVRQFVCDLPPGSSLLDVGCGNGKYLGLNTTIMQVGCDTSAALLDITLGRGHQSVQGHCLTLPFRDGNFDAVICIAVLHHLASKERRLAALQELARVLRPGGQALIYVWALEQSKAGRHSTYLKQNKKNRKCPPVSLGEVGSENGVISSGSTIHGSLSDNEQKTEFRADTTTKFNSLPVHENRTNFTQQDMLVPWKVKPQRGQSSAEAAAVGVANDVPVYHRYYHTFQDKELEELCHLVKGVDILKSYYDEGNWCVLLLKQE